jgi:hypothetical protein
VQKTLKKSCSQGNKIKDERVGACSLHGRDQENSQNWVGKPKGMKNNVELQVSLDNNITMNLRNELLPKCLIVHEVVE